MFRKFASNHQVILRSRSRSRKCSGNLIVQTTQVLLFEIRITREVGEMDISTIRKVKDYSNVRIIRTNEVFSYQDY